MSHPPYVLVDGFLPLSVDEFAGALTQCRELSAQTPDPLRVARIGVSVSARFINNFEVNPKTTFKHLQTDVRRSISTPLQNYQFTISTI